MKTYNFRITEEQKKLLEADLAKFNKLADKLNCTRAVLNASAPSLGNSPHHKVNTIKDVSWTIPQINFYDCELTGSTVIAGDYTFIGCIEYSTVDGVTKVVSAENSLYESYKDSLPVCEHCNTKRKRKITFILQSIKDGSRVQVGSTCLKDFLGYEVSDLVKALKFSMKFMNVQSNYPHGFDKNTKAHKVEQYGVKEILMLTNAVIRIFGWHSKDSETHIPTKDLVTKLCNEPESYESVYWMKKINEKRADVTDANIAAEIHKWISSDEQKKNHSEYMCNLRSVVSKGLVTTSQFGLLCSSVNSFKSYIKRKLEANSNYENKHVGKVGKRQEFEVKCIDVKKIDSYYGETTLHKMVDKDNHLLVWFSSSDLVIPKDQFVKIKGTVKKHDTFNHVNQTMLSRVARVK